MLWQDGIISVANVVFSISLIPQIMYCQRTKKGLVSLQTSIPTSLGLYAIALAFFSLKLYFSAAISLVTATLWLIMMLQRVYFGSARP